MNDQDPLSGFEATFHQNSKPLVTPAPSTTLQQKKQPSEGNVLNEMSVSPVENNRIIPSENCEGDSCDSDKFKNMKVKVSFNDAESSMPRFTNSQTNGLRCSPRISDKEPKY